MKLLKFWYQPEAEVEFTRKEVDELIRLSEKHYDMKCRALSQQGGVLFGMRNMFDGDAPTETIVYRLDMSHAQLVAKTAENNCGLLYKLANIVTQHDNAWKGVNGLHGMKGND